MTIIIVYVPTVDENKRNAEDVERFCNKFPEVCDKTPRNDTFTLLGDFNANLEKNIQIKA